MTKDSLHRRLSTEFSDPDEVYPGTEKLPMRRKKRPNQKARANGAGKFNFVELNSPSPLGRTSSSNRGFGGSHRGSGREPGRGRGGRNFATSHVKDRTTGIAKKT